MRMFTQLQWSLSAHQSNALFNSIQINSKTTDIWPVQTSQMSICLLGSTRNSNDRIEP